MRHVCYKLLLHLRGIFSNLFRSSNYEFQEVIQQNLFEDLNLEDLAFLTNLSLSSFKRKFASTYQTTPNKYIVTKRLEKAQNLLKTSELGVAEIAYEELIRRGLPPVKEIKTTWKAGDEPG